MSADFWNGILADHAAAQAAAAPKANCFGMKDRHRGWTIEQGPDDNFYAFGPNHDASYEGEEDGWVSNGESVSASTYDDVIEEIDNWFEENGQFGVGA